MSVYNDQDNVSQPRSSARKRLAYSFPRGFTLIELLVVLAIVAVLLMVATPNYNSIFVSSRVDEARMSIASSLAMARSEAVKRSQTVRLCKGGGLGLGTTCGTTETGPVDWTSGWRVIVNGAVAQAVSRDDTRVTVEYSCGDVLAFSSAGARNSGGSSECNFKIYDPSGDGSNDKYLHIAPTGRVRLN